MPATAAAANAQLDAANEELSKLEDAEEALRNKLALAETARHRAAMERDACFQRLTDARNATD